MSYQLDWHLPNRVLLVDYQGIITFDDLQQVLTEMLAYLNTAEKPIHTVIDLSHVTRIAFQPKELNLLTELHCQVMMHPKNGWQVYCDYTSKTFFEFISLVLINFIYMAKFKFVASPKEGMTFLKSLDTHLA